MEGLSSALNDIRTSFTNGFNTLNNTFNFAINNLLNGLTTSLNTILNTLRDLPNFIQSYFSGLINAVGEVLSTAFIPRSDFFEENILMLQNTFSSKFNFNLSLILPSTSFGDTQSFTIPFLYGTTINFDWFNPYRYQFKGMLSVVFYTFTLIFVLKNLKELYT